MRSIIKDLKVVVEISMIVVTVMAMVHFIPLIVGAFFDRYYEAYFWEEEDFKQEIDQERIKINPNEFDPDGYYG